MAYSPGILTQWPWEPLGNFKYVLVAPGVIHSIYLYIVKSEERSLFYLNLFPFMLWRMLHNQIWISLSRYRTAKGKNLIIDRSIDFEQVDRERNWDDQILFTWIVFNSLVWGMDAVRNAPIWRMDGLLQMLIVHIGPVEFLYYWFHRALHHHYLYSRYHSHHHSSIVTEPITATVTIYITCVDLMNNMGHCNFEVIPKWVFTIFPPLKYLMYTPSFHSLHHTQFRTNYSLFMPFYDYIYGMMDKFTDTVYESSLKKPEDVPDVVHLTHLTTLQSVCHLRAGFASLASEPLNSKWYMWPVITLLCSLVMTWVYGKTFVVERNTFQELKAQSWVVPCYKKHYYLQKQQKAIDKLIEGAIIEANNKGVKVMSLGLFNQAREQLNRNGEIYLERHPDLKVKVVDGSSLAVAVVLSSIPKGTSKVLFRGSLSKVAYCIVTALYHKGVKVVTKEKDEHEKLKEKLMNEDGINLIHSEMSYNHYKNWLPRRVMNASRVALIVHALEGWNANECGDKTFDIDKVWEASLRHGFRPFLTLF